MTLSVRVGARSRERQPAREGNGPGYTRTVIAGFVVLAAANAVGFYGLAVYLGGLQAGGRFSLGLVSTLTSAFFLTSGLTGLLVGRSLARVSVRALLIAGAAVTAVAVWLVGHATAPWQLATAYILLGVGMSMTGPIPLTTALISVPTASSERRNQAMAVMLSGMTAGGAIFVPVLAVAVERYGLAAATSLAAPLGLAGIVLPALLLGRAGTGRKGKEGTESPSATGSASPSPDAEPDEQPSPRARRAFLVLTMAFTGLLGAQVGFNTQLYTIASELGLRGAAAALGLVAGTGMAARLVGIVLVRWVPPERFLAGMSVSQCLSPLALLVIPGEAGLYAAAVLLGMAVGNGSVLSPILTLKIIGRKAFSRYVSRLSFVMTLGIASGPMAAGGMRSATGNYNVVLAGVAVVSLLAAVLCVVVERIGRPVVAHASRP